MSAIGSWPASGRARRPGPRSARRTGSGSSPATTSASVTFSSTCRRLARTATQTSRMVLGGPRVVGRLRRRVLNVGERPLDRPDHIGDRDLLRLLGEPVATARPAPGPHQPRVLELEQDVLEELQRDLLRFGEPLALDGLLVGRGGQLQRGPNRVVGFGGDPHFVTMRVSSTSSERARCWAGREVVGSMIDLQAHSTVSDGQLAPSDVAIAAADAGVTVMSLTDHDAVAGVPDAIEAAQQAGIECVPAVEMSCVHRYSDDLHMLGYWVDLDAIAPACARAQEERVSRAREIIERLNALRRRGHLRGRGRRGRGRGLDRASPYRPCRRRRTRPRPLLRGVSGARREGLRAAELAERRRGRRADPRSRRRGRRRPSLLGRLRAEPGARPGLEPASATSGWRASRPSTPRTRRRRRRTVSSSARSSTSPRPAPRISTVPTHKTFSRFGRLRHVRPGRAAGAAPAVTAGT